MEMVREIEIEIEMELYVEIEMPKIYDLDNVETRINLNYFRSCFCFHLAKVNVIFTPLATRKREKNTKYFTFTFVKCAQNSAVEMHFSYLFRKSIKYENIISNK